MLVSFACEVYFELDRQNANVRLQKRVNRLGKFCRRPGRRAWQN